jgi:ABC-2 type transport system permease protein
MRHWLRSYRLLLRWNLLQVRSTLPLLLVVQTLIGVGVVIGFSFLVPQMDAPTALYLATGAPTIALIIVGMVMVPQVVAQQKLTGVFDYVRAMPVPRLALVAADATVWVGVALPGLLASLGVAALRFDLTFTVSPLVVPAVLLVAASTVAVGYGVGYATKPAVASIISQMLIIVSLMFAPVNFPAERLPDWLAAAHRWLPFTYMAQAVRETLSVPPGGVPALPFTVLAAWAAVGLAITYRVMTRRP